MPTLDYPPFGELDFIRDMLAEPDQRWRLLEGGPLAASWDPATNGPRADVPGAAEALYLAAVQVFAERRAAEADLPAERGAEVAGEQLIAQWGKDEGPMRPLGRLATVLADVALEFVGANPGVLGVGGNGEKLIGAFAANLAEMIPDDASVAGPRSRFADQVVGIVVRAGLETLARHPDAVVGSRPLQQLVRTMVPPVVQQLPADLSEQARWRDVVEALMGPATGAAIATLVGDPRLFLGLDSGAGDTLGVLTQAMLQQANRLGLDRRLTEAGWITLYRGAVALGAERPELFRHAVATPATGQALFEQLGGALASAPPPFDGDLGGDVAVAALEAVRMEGPRFLAGTSGPDGLAALVGQITGGLAAALAEPASVALRGPLSRRQVGDLARALVTQAARVPGLIGGDRRELAGIVESIARLIASDDRGLLAPAEWQAIAAVAASEAFANPGRLFDDAHGGPAVTLVGGLLTAAAASDRSKGDVLFGATLRDATILGLRAVAAASSPSARGGEAVRDLALRLSAQARQRGGRVASAQWLALFRRTVDGAIATGAVQLDDHRFDELLAGTVAV